MSKKPELRAVTDEDAAQAQATLNDADDIESLWSSPSITDDLAVTALHTVPVGKPKDFFRVVADPTYRRRVDELYLHKPEDVIEREYYIVSKSMRGRIEAARPALIVTVIYRTGTPRLWPIFSPRPGEKDFPAWASARVAARIAMERWVKLVWMGGAYQTREALPGYAPEPDGFIKRLPPFNELVRLAFGTSNIVRADTHPIYRDQCGSPPIDDDGGDAEELDV
jgi:hypothetical protein